MEVKTGKFIIVNGIEFPYPSKEPKFINSTFVNSGRNANAKVVAEVIGREQYKIDSLKWNVLPAETWNMMCTEFAKFFITVTFPCMTTGKPITIDMYVGDRSAIPLELDENDNPISYKECTCNFIDMGK